MVGRRRRLKATTSEARVNVALFNAGSSSLRCTLMDARTRAVLARASADWAGSVTRYERTAAGGKRIVEEVSFRRHANAAERMVDDLALRAAASSVGAAGHRVVHGGAFRS